MDHFVLPPFAPWPSARSSMKARTMRLKTEQRNLEWPPQVCVHLTCTKLLVLSCIRTLAVNNETGTRRSEHAGKGNGCQLVQMQQFEQLQMEWSKWQSRIDIVTQGEDINLMAPSSQNICERGSRTGRVSSNEEVTSETQDQLAPASLQPEFVLAAPGQ